MHLEGQIKSFNRDRSKVVLDACHLARLLAAGRSAE
jgi:hypothetical protein